MLCRSDMEQWKAIPGYEGIYEASTDGRIRTAKGKTTSSKHSIRRVWKQRVMKQKCCTNIKGRCDLRVELWKDGNHKTWLVSRLIALTWCDGYQDGMTVNHINGNHLDNRAKNLEWISLKDNIRHGFNNGLFHTQIRCSLVDENGNTHIFNSQAQASRSIGRVDSYIANCKKKNRQITSIDGTKYTLVKEI